MIALVDPQSAMSTAMALRNAASVRMFAGFTSSHTISTMRLPQSMAMRTWLESAAGIDDAPGSVIPNASVSAVMVEAVPMVMQKPGDRAMPPSMAFQSASLTLPAHRSVQYF